MNRFHQRHSQRRWVGRGSPLRRLGRAIADGLLVAFWSLCGRLSPARASALGAAVMARLGPRSAKSHAIRANLRLAFAELSPAELSRLEAGLWRNMGAVMGEYPHLGNLGRPTASGAGAGLVADIPAALEANFRGLRPTVFVTGHLGNWEVLAAAPRLWQSELAVVYTPLGDGLADRWLRAYRERMGATLLPRDGSARALWRHLKSGRPIGIVADHRDDEGEPLPFFGRSKLTTLSPARLALRAGADLVAVRVERLGPARFKIGAAGPIRPPAGAASDSERAIAMMTEFNRLLEGWIRERPEQWFCGKRAFAKKLVKALDAGPPPLATPNEIHHAQ